MVALEIQPVSRPSMGQPTSPNNPNNRERKFESFEPRLALSAHSLADIAITTQIQPDQIAGLSGLNQQAAIVSGNTGSAAVSNIFNDYGFDGRGQTVAVIDTGIAWDHYALGGGFGAGSKVVGGWDFAENDANPYDDGPAGFHGTHVAGIIGNTDANYRGVSSGVDLVSLRVFDDAGGGNLQWVEQALQWVHDHRNDFVNPITTVNLSLGTTWNSSTVPDWAELESEFAQLEADGIFISVAAGNSFKQYNTPGVSYPAASEHVVPVASHGADGKLSDFSQRDSRSLVAPGELIRSTVPDHLFFGSKTGQFLGTSGTSMAAPWVAGASTLLREAFDFMGQKSVNQDMLYQTFRDSADRVFDSVTGGWYSRVNLEKAIASIVTDAQGDTFETASNLGTINGGVVVNGTIGRISDVDAFGFTAGKTGRMTLSFETTDSMQTRVAMAGSNVNWSGNQVSFDVVAGQQYKFAVSTGDGIGHYRMNAAITANVATNWGNVADLQKSNVQVSGAKTFEVHATQNGLMTVSGQVLTGNVSYTILDSNMQAIHSGQLNSAGSRLDFQSTAGEKLFIRLDGNGSANLRMTNLISLDNSRLTVFGTSGNDRVEIVTGTQWAVEVNGIAYSFSGSEIQEVVMGGGAGHDTLKVILGQGNHDVHMQPNGISITGQNIRINGGSFETLIATAGTGQNNLWMTGTAGSDTLTSSGNMFALTGSGYGNYGIAFKSVIVNGLGGIDTANLQGTSGNDQLAVATTWANMVTGNSNMVAVQFEQIRFSGLAGDDLVNLHDSTGNDRYTIGNYRANAQVGQVSVSADGVERVNAFSHSGQDTVQFTDTAGNDQFYSSERMGMIDGNGFRGYATGMNTISVESKLGGNDTAQLTDSQGNDDVWMTGGQSVIASGASRTTTTGFSRTNIVSSLGGTDTVNMYGTTGQDSVYSTADATSMNISNGKLNRAVGFGNVLVDGRGGADFAYLVGTQNVDRLTASSTVIQLTRGVGNRLEISNTSQINFEGSGGADELVFSGFGSGDELTGTDVSALIRLAGTTISARDFALLEARTLAGQTAFHDIAAVDYLFMLDGNWQAKN